MINKLAIRARRRLFPRSLRRFGSRTKSVTRGHNERLQHGGGQPRRATCSAVLRPELLPDRGRGALRPVGWKRLLQQEDPEEHLAEETQAGHRQERKCLFAVDVVSQGFCELRVLARSLMEAVAAGRDFRLHSCQLAPVSRLVPVTLGSQ